MKKILQSVIALFLFIGYSPAWGQAPTYNANTKNTLYSAPWSYGSNLGYYGYSSSWPYPGAKINGTYNDSIPGHIIASHTNTAGLNAHSMRSLQTDANMTAYGNAVSLPFQRYYVNQLGLTDNVFMLNGPATAHQDTKTYNIPAVPAGTTLYPATQGFKNLYNTTNNGNIWNSDGTPDTANTFVAFVKHFVQTYGPPGGVEIAPNGLKFLEVWNEPDIVTNQNVVNSWYTSFPQPQVLYNSYQPAPFYARMLRITYEVSHHYYPNCHVATGGLGYPPFLYWLLHHTDNPGTAGDGDPAKGAGLKTTAYPNFAGAYMDDLSLHNYPGFGFNTYDPINQRQKLFANSDTALQLFHKFVFGSSNSDTNSFIYKLNAAGYNGTLYPRKSIIVTETDLPSTNDWPLPYTYGSDEIQRNYTMKIEVMLQKWRSNGYKVNAFWYYSLADEGDLPNGPSNADNVATYEGKVFNIKKITNYSQIKYKQAGLGIRTISGLCSTYAFDSLKTVALNLPSTCEGAAFTKPANGSNPAVTRYVLWAKCTASRTESIVGNNQKAILYTFPAGTTISKVWNWDASATVNNAYVDPSNFPYQSVVTSSVNLTGTPIIIQ